MGGSGRTHKGLKEQREGVHEMRVAAIGVVEPEDGVFALVQAGAGVEVERLIRVRYAQCDHSPWRNAVYRVQPGVVDEVDVR